MSGTTQGNGNGNGNGNGVDGATAVDASVNEQQQAQADWKSIYVSWVEIVGEVEDIESILKYTEQEVVNVYHSSSQRKQAINHFADTCRHPSLFVHCVCLLQ
jgi:hypothetical protein